MTEIMFEYIELIANELIVATHDYLPCSYYFYRVVDSINGSPVYTIVNGGYEWCEENDMDYMNMSDEDAMAFKLRWT